eukprot:scaffold25879_cov45-Cyclotella_meneghiniana.AAC.2
MTTTAHSILQILLLYLTIIQRGYSQEVTITDVISSSPTSAPSAFEQYLPDDDNNQISSPTIIADGAPSPAVIADNAAATTTTAQTQQQQRVPTPVPTYYPPPTDDLLGSFGIPTSLTVYGVLSITFPTSSSYNTSRVDAIGSTIENFLSEKGNFTSVPVTVDVEYGDTFGVIEPQEGKTSLSATISITVPWLEMNQISFMDEYALQLLISQIFDSNEEELNDVLSNTFGYGDDVEFSFVVILTPPTAMPTMSPTTAEAFNAYKRKLTRRSWLLVTLFWVIVLGCFSLENGLCACERWRRKKEEYRGVELGSGGGFD